MIIIELDLFLTLNSSHNNLRFNLWFLFLSLELFTVHHLIYMVFNFNLFTKLDLRIRFQNTLIIFYMWIWWIWILFLLYLLMFVKINLTARNLFSSYSFEFVVVLWCCQVWIIWIIFTIVYLQLLWLIMIIIIIKLCIILVVLKCVLFN